MAEKKLKATPDAAQPEESGAVKKRRKATPDAAQPEESGAAPKRRKAAPVEAQPEESGAVKKKRKAAPDAAQPEVSRVAEKKLKVTLVKSPIGNQIRHKRTVKALGLNHVNATIVHPDNLSVRGMIFRVKHLVKVEEIEE